MRHHENWLKAYMHYTRRSEAPDMMHFWTGVSTIAGALRRRVWVNQLKFQWTPNFYIILVGPPGVVTKSTTVRLGTKILASVPGIHWGPQSMTWQGLTEVLADAGEMVPLKDKADLLNQEYLPMAALTCNIKELGTFLRVENGELLDVLTGLWDGELETWDRKTKTQGETSIENPWINLIGCTTPAWIRDNVPEVMIGGGFASRVIFVYGDKKRHLVAYPARGVDEAEFEAEGDKLKEDLQHIAKLLGKYELTEEAMDWGTAWYKSHWTDNIPTHLAGARYEGYRARKQTHIHKLAIVLAAAKRDELIIEKEDLVKAEQIITVIEGNMNYVFSNIGVPEASKHVREIMMFLRTFKKMPQIDLWRKVLPIMNSKDFTLAIHAASNAGYIRTLNDEKLGVMHEITEAGYRFTD